MKTPFLFFESLNAVLHLLKGYKQKLFPLLLLMLAASLAEVVSIGAVIPFLSVIFEPEAILKSVIYQPILEKVGIQQPREIAALLVTTLILAIVFAAVLRLWLYWSITKFSFLMGAYIGDHVFTKTLNWPYSRHIATNSSEMVSALSMKVSLVTYNILLPILTIISSCILLAGIVGALIFLNISITIFVLSIVIFTYLLISKVTKKLLNKHSQIISFESSKIIQHMQEGYGGIRDIILDRTQKTFIDSFKSSDLALRKSQGYVMFLANCPRFIIESFGVIIIFLLAFFFTSEKNGVFDTLPFIAMVGLAFQRMLPIAQQLYTSLVNIRGNYSSLVDILELIDEQSPEVIASQTSKDPLFFENTIDFRGVSFKYSENTRTILNNLNLKISKGCCVGISGSSGCGKSTLIDLLIGLLTPSSGEIFVDGIQINPNNISSWQKSLAHVPQEIFVLDASIAQNIAFGVEPHSIDHELVKSCAEYAHIADHIENLPDKYNTYVGERGVALSGGQRQRVGIARALYKRAKVVIFDEATSALDLDTENKLLSSIINMNKDVTFFIVAHRYSAFQNCDFIINIDKGGNINLASYDSTCSQLKY